MVKRRRSPDSEGTTSDAAAYNTLFIDTNLGTHLAFMFTDSETVSDLKDKVVLEHGRCFPEIGEIKIRAVKVEKKGSFYHVPDFMFVKSAFEGVNESWFLYVDASKCNDVFEFRSHGATNQRALLTTNLHDQDHLHDDCFKTTCNVHKVGDADVQNGNSSKPKCTIRSSTQEFKDDNVPNDVRNLGSYSSGQSVETCNSAKRHKRKHNSLLATSASNDNKMSPQALHSNKLQFDTEITTVNTQNKANKLLGSHVECEPQRDGQETSSGPGDSSKKKRSKVSRSGVQDEHVDRSTNSTADFGLLLPNVAASGNQICQSTVEKGVCSSKADAGAVEQHLSTKIVDTDEATEGLNCGGKKKKRKVKKSGDAVKDQQQNRESIGAENGLNLKQVSETEMSRTSKYPDVLQDFEVNDAIEDGKGLSENKQTVEKAVARVQETVGMNRKDDQINDIVSPSLGSHDPVEGVNCGGKKKIKKVKNSGAVVAANDLNLKQVPETNLPSNSECPDVRKGFEVNKATDNGKAIGEKKKKKEVEKAVAKVQEMVDMSRDADQINDIVSPSLDSPDPGNLVPAGENNEMYQKVKERDLLVKNNLEEMVSARDNEPIIETVSKTNTSTAIVAHEQKLSGTRMKRRARKTVSGVCQDGMDTENNETRTRPSSSTDRHADLQVEKDKDLSPGSKGIEASARKSSDTSIGKNAPPMDLPLNQVSAVLKIQKDGEVSECIGKEINFKQYFVPSQHQDEVSGEPSAGTVAKKKREEVVPSADSAPKLRQDIPKSSKKDSLISSAGKTNTLTESNKVTKTKKKNGKRAVPYATTSSDLDEIRTLQKPISSALSTDSDATKTVARKKETVKSLASSGVNSSLKTPLKPMSSAFLTGSHATMTVARKKETVKSLASSGVNSSLKTPLKPMSSAFSTGSDATKTVASKKETVKSLASSGVNSKLKTPLKSNTRDRKISSLRHHVTAGKNTSSKLDGEVVNKSKQRKSNLQTPKAIFRDVSSESSLDENGSVDSTASTRTPSDNLSSSSDLSDDAMGNARDDKDKGMNKKSVPYSEISGPEQIPLDTILKSSSRFKKAKLTASQQFENPDNQFGDLLPETEL